MDTTPDLKLVGTAYVDGTELACAECGNTFSLEIHRHGAREVEPAWISCLSCGTGRDSTVVTNGLVDAVLAAWTARRADGDRDLFAVEWRGLVMTGELYPTLDIHQAVGAVKAVHEVAAPEVRRWWRSKKKAVKREMKAKRRQVTGVAKEKTKEAAGAAKAAAITADWNLRTGGAGPQKSARPRSPRCTVKGCRAGMVVISTRIHEATGTTREIKVPCGVCHRSRT
ncbi:hypothetical protein [Streptomyces acidiscabies]|uniref:hypothetical protein n=1 Tax=Streptomyces acidiscabies TaxID=42234 RepID=UPI000E67E03D|nr:hypothetical protein [Streptomyces acidiscabies]MBP5942589.1 hypothetical protein [Streptomyces sp. LBUM 1476]